MAGICFQYYSSHSVACFQFMFLIFNLHNTFISLNGNFLFQEWRFPLKLSRASSFTHYHVLSKLVLSVVFSTDNSSSKIVINIMQFYQIDPSLLHSHCLRKFNWGGGGGEEGLKNKLQR